jgi:hypothetical protein
MASCASRRATSRLGPRREGTTFACVAGVGRPAGVAEPGPAVGRGEPILGGGRSTVLPDLRILSGLGYQVDGTQAAEALTSSTGRDRPAVQRRGDAGRGQRQPGRTAELRPTCGCDLGFRRRPGCDRRPRWTSPTPQALAEAAQAAGPRSAHGVAGAGTRRRLRLGVRPARGLSRRAGGRRGQRAWARSAGRPNAGRRGPAIGASSGPPGCEGVAKAASAEFLRVRGGQQAVEVQDLAVGGGRRGGPVHGGGERPKTRRFLL